jgi:hypothetical protein
MNCQECELVLASEEWDVGVDGRVEAHLSECVACREFAVELRENSEALRAFARETLPVGPRLGQRVARHGAAPYQRAAWRAAVAAVLVLGFVSSWAALRSRSARLSSPPVLRFQTPSAQMTSAASTKQGVAQAILPPSGFEAVPPPVKRQVARRPRQAPREALRTDNQPRILQVKMLTDDPNVVIYWQIEN